MVSLKEMLPVRYNSSGINHLSFTWEAGENAFPYHFHERLEILFVVSGELHVYIDEKEYIATADQTVIISPFEKHKGYAGADGVKYHVITFRISDFTNASDASKKYLSFIAQNSTNFKKVVYKAELAQAIKGLVSYLEYGNTVNPLCSMGKMYEVIGLLYQYASVSGTQVQNAPKEDGFSRVIQYIDLNFLSNISTKDISSKFGYNVAYFCRKFKNETGTTVMKFILELKLEYGKNLLLATKESVNSIASKSGFSDKSHFSNCFKKRYGISPTEYRKAHKAYLLDSENN